MKPLWMLTKRRMNLKTKVDGEEGKAKLSDLITSYQLRAHFGQGNTGCCRGSARP